NDTYWNGSQYRHQGRFSHGSPEEYLRTTKKGKFGLLDGDGNLIAEPIYDNLGPMVNGYAPVKMGDKIGFIDKKGKLVLETDLESITAFGDLMAGHDLHGQWHVIDRRGNL